MANIKISDLTSASAAADANEYEINEAGTSKKVTGSQIKAFVNADDGALAAKDTVATADIDNLAVTNGKLAADAVDGTKIADDAIDSEHIAADSIDAEHYAAGSVDTTALANASVTTPKISATGTADANTFLSGAGTWTAAGGGGTYYMQVFNNPGTWTKPANVSSIRTTVIGGGAGYFFNSTGGAGGTSSFGAYSSATGGASVPGNPNTSLPGTGSGGTLNFRGQHNVTNSSTYQRSAIGPHAAVFSVGNVFYGGNTWINATGFGAGSFRQDGSSGNGAGGAAIEYLPETSVPGPVSVTVGNRGNPGGNPGNDPSSRLGTKGGVVVEWWD